MTFLYKGGSITIRVGLPKREFEKYGDLPHSSALPLEYYMAVSYHDRLARKVVALAKAEALRNGWGERDLAQLLVFIAQYLPYAADSFHSVGDYVRFPGETLLMAGDCEDKSLLAYSLLAAAGFDVALFSFRSKGGGHVLVGLVVEPGPEDTILLEASREYVLVEVSAPRWSLGHIGEPQVPYPLEVHRVTADPRLLMPRGLKDLGLSHADLSHPAFVSWIDPEKPAVLQATYRKKWLKVLFPSEEMAQEVLGFVEKWRAGLSPYFLDVERVRSISISEDEVELTWD